MLKLFRSALSWQNAWRIRIVALGTIVLLVGVSSQVLVNAITAGAPIISLKVTAYASQGRMADGNWTRSGACAVSATQFSLGTVIALYKPDGSFVRQCTAEDTDSNLGYGHINLAMPRNIAAVMHWGERYLLAQVLRFGWGSGGSPHLNTASSLIW
jgi:hypothetical protein